jgi:uncharacterized protein
MNEEIPLFPLRTVLFPGGVLPLRIFETRYVDMIRSCMRSASGFGVVLIQQGAETGPVASVHDVGTAAQIVDFTQLEDGLLGITTVGQYRFRVTAARTQRDGLNIGTVSRIADEPHAALPADYAPLSALLREALPQLGALYQHFDPQYEDAGWVGQRLAEILPIELDDRQYCLELDDPIARLEYLRPLIRAATAESGD